MSLRDAATTVLRYLFYIAFVFVAIVFWLLAAVFVLGFSMGDPACVLDRVPCPKPGIIEYAGRTLLVFAAMPATALSFYFYRRAVRAMFGLD